MELELRALWAKEPLGEESKGSALETWTSSSLPSRKCLLGGIFTEFYMHLLMNSHSSFLRLNVIVIINLYVRKQERKSNRLWQSQDVNSGKLGISHRGILMGSSNNWRDRMWREDRQMQVLMGNLTLRGGQEDEKMIRTSGERGEGRLKKTWCIER